MYSITQDILLKLSRLYLIDYEELQKFHSHGSNLWALLHNATDGEPERIFKRKLIL